MSEFRIEIILVVQVTVHGIQDRIFSAESLSRRVEIIVVVYLQTFFSAECK